jgi:carbamoyltransferase
MARQQFEYHPVIGYRFIPGLRARIPHENGGYLVSVNNIGFRCDHDFVAKKRPGIFRVLLFGDSNIGGDGVSNSQRFGDLLEKEIPGLEIYNFGLPGSGTDQQYLIYQEYAGEIEYDLLMLAVTVENIRRVVARYRYSYTEDNEEMCYEKPYYELVDGKLVLKSVPPSKSLFYESDLPKEERTALDRGGRFRGLRNLVIKSGLKDLVQKATRYQPLPEYDTGDNPAWQLMRTIFLKWITECSSEKVLLVPVPLYQYVEGSSDPSKYQARFHEIVSETGCMFHDPLPDMIKYPPAERRNFRFKVDQHLSPRGHSILAKSLTAPLVGIRDGKNNGAMDE